ncbi:MAG TPA: hypothetical protein PLX06_01350 [Fimbriimonadaceae bacterium]|nr:hypothetical protein [Fimbriimonadaceae bacterium]
MKRTWILMMSFGLAAGLVASGVQTVGKQAQPRSISWVRTAIGTSEMTVELPGTSRPVPMEQRVRSNYDILQTQGVSNEDFAAFASYAVSREQQPINLDVAARGALDRIKNQPNVKDFKETITTVTVVGLPGRKIQCSFSNEDQKLFLAGLIFTDRTRMWQVICTGQANTSNTNNSNKVLASIKRASEGSKSAS